MENFGHPPTSVSNNTMPLAAAPIFLLLFQEFSPIHSSEMSLILPCTHSLRITQRFEMMLKSDCDAYSDSFSFLFSNDSWIVRSALDHCPEFYLELKLLIFFFYIFYIHLTWDF